MPNLYQTSPIAEFHHGRTRSNTNAASSSNVSSSHNTLLPTKIKEISFLDGSVTYELYPSGQTSRWTAQPVLQWIESLAATTESIDHRGTIHLNGISMSDPTPAVIPLAAVVTPTFTATLPPVSDDAVCNWDFLSRVEYDDPMSPMYLSQIKTLASHYEECIRKAAMMTTTSPMVRNGSTVGSGSVVPHGMLEKWKSSYHTAQTRFEFQFLRIMEQHAKDYPTASSAGEEDDSSNNSDDEAASPATNLETGEARVLLDTLYEETIEKLKSLINEQQAYMKRRYKGSPVKVTSAAHQAMTQHMQPLQPSSKQDLAKYMTAWLRANFTNPYPDDEGLVEMATMYGTTNQVISNWLINARTRKWRPALIKASESGRPADLLLEDALNLFDGKPLREINPADYPSMKYNVHTGSGKPVTASHPHHHRHVAPPPPPPSNPPPSYHHPLPRAAVPDKYETMYRRTAHLRRHLRDNEDVVDINDDNDECAVDHHQPVKRLRTHY